jgi:hypothetical protein
MRADCHSLEVAGVNEHCLWQEGHFVGSNNPEMPRSSKGAVPGLPSMFDDHDYKKSSILTMVISYSHPRCG